jgi:mRNA interferase MazF
MTNHTMIYKPFSIVAVPFPFTDKDYAKKRPSIVISSVKHQEQTNHISLLMITSAKNSSWSSDYAMKYLEGTGITSPSIVRQKLFTIDSRLVIKNIGELSTIDKEEVIKRIFSHLSLHAPLH